MLEHLDDFMQDIGHGVHAAELITEIFRNNQKLHMFNLTPIVRKVCQIVDDLPLESPRKATMASFLPPFIKCESIVIKEN